MWEKSHKKREKERVLKMTKKSRKIGHYSETTGQNELKFRLVFQISTWLLKGYPLPGALMAAFDSEENGNSEMLDPVLEA